MSIRQLLQYMVMNGQNSPFTLILSEIAGYTDDRIRAMEKLVLELAEMCPKFRVIVQRTHDNVPMRLYDNGRREVARVDDIQPIPRFKTIWEDFSFKALCSLDERDMVGVHDLMRLSSGGTMTFGMSRRGSPRRSASPRRRRRRSASPRRR